MQVARVASVSARPLLTVLRRASLSRLARSVVSADPLVALLSTATGDAVASVVVVLRVGVVFPLRSNLLPQWINFDGLLFEGAWV